MEREFSANENLFPQDRRLKSEFRTLLEQTVFAGFGLRIDKRWVKKRLVLGAGEQSLPFMVWSAGQREFVHILGLYWLMPSAAVARRGQFKWVVLEEPEMGLHPRAITVLLLMVLDLVNRGYRVCLSTHSTQVLETVWACNTLRRTRRDIALLKMFGAGDTTPVRKPRDPP